jgi:ChaC-like protein
MTVDQHSVWVFGYGSLIWDTGAVQTIERREGFLHGWHREWTWISEKRRHGAPTCSLKQGGQVRGVFLRIAPLTLTQDLAAFSTRENPRTEETVADIPEAGAVTHFWTMGSNLEITPEFKSLQGDDLATALAERAKRITTAGPDDVLAIDYIRKVHEFDPDDALTAAITGHL